MELRLRGLLYSGLSSQAHEAVLVVDQNGAHFETALSELTNIYPLSSLRLSPRLGSIPRTLETEDGRRFETYDFTASEQLEALLGRTGFLHRLEGQWRVAIPIALSLLLTVFVIYKVVIPSLAVALAPLVPGKVREQISKPLEFYLDKTHPQTMPLLPAQQTRFDQAKKDVRAAYLRLKAIDLLDEESPNAFILPNGHVYVTKGLVEIATSSDEILAVLLHEVGHQVYSHVMQCMIENLSLSGLITLISGGTEWTNVPILLLGNTYSRANELMADDYSIRRMRELGKDPKSFADIFERIEAKSVETKDIPTFLSTHPSFKERIERIRELKKH